MFLANLQTGVVKIMLTSVGRGSVPDGDDWAKQFSNIPNSHMSSLGSYLTANEYIGGNGRTLRLHGLSDTNSNAFQRFIVVHGAAYVSEAAGRAGRSLGYVQL